MGRILIIIFDHQMEKKIKTGVLIIACIITVLTLSCIQFYLVKNTYTLTKGNYYMEVRKSMSQVTSSPGMVALEDSAKENLRKGVELYTKSYLTKKEFLIYLKKVNTDVMKRSDRYIAELVNKIPELKEIRFKSQYDEIVVEYRGLSDTLLKEHAIPLTFLGTVNKFENSILLNKDIAATKANYTKKVDGQKMQEVNLRILAKQSNYVDISNWKTEVLNRMAGIFIMAAGLILAVTVLFYLVFDALLRQKKIAEIKTDFANNVTHELKTPLSSVNLILKSIRRTDVQGKPEMLNDLLNSLERQHAKIQQLVDSVLESSTITTMRVEIHEIEITKLLQHYVLDLAVPDHQIIAEINSVPQSLKTNPATIEKIMSILVDNAAKYSAPGEPITIKGNLVDQYYTISIIDQGPGISLHHQKHIFDKFYRVPEQDRHTIKGLGLGLYLAKQAASQIGAEVTFQSKAGEGCTFRIGLPL